MAYQAAVEGQKLRKGPWLEEEDVQLAMSVKLKGDRKWEKLAKESGLMRSGRSCRLRWMNYLRPNLKHGHITVDEEKVILKLHELWGNKWSKIAQMLPGRLHKRCLEDCTNIFDHVLSSQEVVYISSLSILF